jgi:hypothetical protein
VSFSGAEFGGAVARFDRCKFVGGDVNFDSVTFEGRCEFRFAELESETTSFRE